MATAEQQPALIEPEMNLAQIEAVVASASNHLQALEALVATQEASLDDLYAQQELAQAAGEDDRVRQLTDLIDRLNLTLTNLEAERDSIAVSIATLQSQIEILMISGD
jgi:multidrug resistance efflux pump